MKEEKFNYKQAFLLIQDFLNFFIETDKKLPKSPCDTPKKDKKTGIVCVFEKTVDFTKGQKHLAQATSELMNEYQKMINNQGEEI